MASGPERKQRQLLVVDFDHPAAWYSGRKFTRSSVRLPGTASAKCSRKASLAASIQWRSSTSSTAGSRRLRARSERRIASKRRRSRSSGSRLRRRALGVGHAEEVEDQGQRLLELVRSSSRMRPAILSRAAWSPSRSPMPKVARKSSSTGSRGTALPCGRPWASKRALGELEAEPALAHARLAHDADHLPLPSMARSRAASRSPSRPPRPTNFESPRARETSRRVRSAPDTLELKTCTGSAPLHPRSPRGRAARRAPRPARAVCSVR